MDHGYRHTWSHLNIYAFIEIKFKSNFLISAANNKISTCKKRNKMNNVRILKGEIGTLFIIIIIRWHALRE